jgi:site-specific recombinase XerD
VTPLRQRFIEDMRLRNYASKTIESYVAGVSQFAKHFNRSPHLLGPQEIREFQLEMLRRRVSWSQFNQIMSGLRLFYSVTLGRPEQLPYIPYGKKPKTLPTMLSPEEVVRFLDATKPGRDRVLFQTAYACGLRLGELIHLQVTDIDNARMVVVVRQGKGRKDRLTDPQAFARFLTPLYHKDWVVYAKRPFGGPKQVLKYLARYSVREDNVEDIPQAGIVPERGRSDNEYAKWHPSNLSDEKRVRQCR